MRFAYKINSAYDGFNPAAIPARMVDGRLRLGWKRYIEAVHQGAEVWIYFRGPDRYIDGIYVEGTVKAVDLRAREVQISVDRHSTGEPLTDERTSEAVASVVRARGRQVFYLPEDLLRVFPCDVFGSASSCSLRHCGQCETWPNLQLIENAELRRPGRLRASAVSGFVPAYWVVARRSWPVTGGRRVRTAIRDTTEVFKRFKTGTAELGYPLAKGMAKTLRDRGLADADFIVPIPLSPDKAAAGELNRTLTLANELSQLIGIDVRRSLELDRPISKRALAAPADIFERRYSVAISCSGMRPSPARILLVDDVCTRGSTLAVASRAIRARYPDCEVIACSAGQMTVKEALARPSTLLAD